MIFSLIRFLLLDTCGTVFAWTGSRTGRGCHMTITWWPMSLPFVLFCLRVLARVLANTLHFTNILNSFCELLHCVWCVYVCVWVCVTLSLSLSSFPRYFSHSLSSFPRYFSLSLSLAISLSLPLSLFLSLSLSFFVSLSLYLSRSLSLSLSLYLSLSLSLTLSLTK